MSRRNADSPRKLRQYDDVSVLDYIDRHKRAAGRSPSERQIATALQLSGKSVAHRIVHRLVRDGLLSSNIPSPGWPADLTVTRPGQYVLAAWRALREQSMTESVAPPATSHAGGAAPMRGAA